MARSFVIPNYTPSGWFESDIFELTKSGYFREYEIKMSLSDFRADAVKAREKTIFERGSDGRTVFKRFKGDTKHFQLSIGNRRSYPILVCLSCHGHPL